MPRQDTKLEAQGAEFLVLGNLLIEGIPAHKHYINMQGYDIIATNPGKNKSARIQVKSRWQTNATGFLIKKFDCDFVVIAKLNRGSKDGKQQKKDPAYYIIPSANLEIIKRTGGWGRMEFGKIPDFHSYLNKWNLIRDFLEFSQSLNKSEIISKPPKILVKSKINGPVGKVREICDANIGKSRKEILSLCLDAGVNPYTAQTQYQAWRKKTGLVPFDTRPVSK